MLEVGGVEQVKEEVRANRGWFSVWILFSRTALRLSFAAKNGLHGNRCHALAPRHRRKHRHLQCD